MRRAIQAQAKTTLLLVSALSLGACGDAGGTGWGLEEAPRPQGATTLARSLGQEATIHGPNSLKLRVSLDFTSRPPVPVSLSPENATFLEVHLSVANTGSVPFSGVLADAADLAVVPSGTLAPVRAESVPTGIALSGVLDFGEPITIPPGSPALSGKVIFQIDPDDAAASFSLSIPGGTETVRWTL